MADDIKNINVKVEKTVSLKRKKTTKKKTVKKVKDTRKEFTLNQPLRFGSKKDGSPKKVYKKGDKIKLDAKKEKLYKSLNLI